MGDLVEAKPRAARPASKSPRRNALAPIADTTSELGQDAADQAAREKAIVLFSDGTGNSSAKLFKTNVWRMYEAVDLGPSPPAKRLQIAFYDNGVGTSALRPLAMLGSVFGFGLKANVLDIYRYACRNYRPGDGQTVGPNPEGKGDELFGFGFSRGGFTMRVAMAMIAEQGLVASEDEADLNAKSLEAYRHFRRKFLPRKLQWPTKALRWFRDRKEAKRRARAGLPPYHPDQNYRPVIRYLGIWDTVAAYGGPIVEITRAIDNWIYPLSMPDYELSDSVRCARHALAIDDSRDAFQPLLWDELCEERAIGQAQRGERPSWIDEKRLQQVWFTGMHADVGGGYPDESLSYVSFLWIMEEAEKAGLRLLRVMTDRYRALANSAGPLHDSRVGVGSYYRYQPRNIEAWVEPPSPSTLTLQDPEICHPDGTPRGLIRRVKVHESVVGRIAYGTDRYAPIALPAEFDVVPPQREGENVPQRDSDTPVAPPLPARPQPLLAEEIWERLSDPDVIARRREAGAEIWHRVWRRRVTYCATVLLTLVVIFYPAVRQLTASGSKFFGTLGSFCTDDRCVLPGIISSLRIFVPEFLEGWIDVAAAHSAQLVGIVILVFVLRAIGSRIEARMRDHSYQVWQAALGNRGWPPVRRRGLIRRLHENIRYQAELRDVKWYVLPSLVGMLMAAALIYVAAIAVTHVVLAVGESRSAFCRSDAVAPPRGTPVDFNIDSRCTRLGDVVEPGRTYRVTFRLPVADAGGEPARWTDGGGPRDRDGNVVGSDPTGLTAGQLGLRGRLGAPFRRVVGARYLQPLIEIRGRARYLAFLGFSSIHIEALELQPDPGDPALFTGTFRTPEDVGGDVNLFVNDAAPLGIAGRFYANNEGGALVTIEEEEAAKPIAAQAKR